MVTVLEILKEMDMTTQIKSIFYLDDLNGVNGMSFSGLLTKDYLGTNVKMIGDINDDGYDDFLIGAPYATRDGNSRAGECYVIFGGKRKYSFSTMDLWSLSGSNGFRITGSSALQFLCSTASGISKMSSIPS